MVLGRYPHRRYLGVGDGTESVRRKAKVGADERYPVPLMDETKIKFFEVADFLILLMVFI